MMKLTLLVVVILYQVVHDLACKTRMWNPSRDEAIAAWDYYIKYSKGEDFKHNPKYHPVSPDTKEEYGRWIIRYVYKKRLQPPQLEWPQEIRHPELFGWGHGEQGENPPPWAINRHLRYELPYYCLDGFAYGDCKANLTCWGLDAFSGLCKEFIWSGCGGNLNRWWRKSDCEKACGSDIHIHSSCSKYATMAEVGMDWSPPPGQ